MYAESHALGMWSSTNHNTATRKHLVHVPVFGVNVVSCMQERWLDDDNLDTYSAVELVQWFTRAAINLCLKYVPAWKQNSPAKQSAPEHS